TTRERRVLTTLTTKDTKDTKKAKIYLCDLCELGGECGHRFLFEVVEGIHRVIERRRVEFRRTRFAAARRVDIRAGFAERHPLFFFAFVKFHGDDGHWLLQTCGPGGV